MVQELGLKVKGARVAGARVSDDSSGTSSSLGSGDAIRLSRTSTEGDFLGDASDESGEDGRGGEAFFRTALRLVTMVKGY